MAFVAPPTQEKGKATGAYDMQRGVVLMESKGTAVLILVVTVAGLFLAYPLLIGLGNGGDGNSTNDTGIVFISVIGNTTDIIYPELGEAQFMPVDLGGWEIDVEMVNDSQGFENVSVYSSTFNADNEEINQIRSALFLALNSSLLSGRTAYDLLNANASIGFLVDMIFDDNTWIKVYTFQGQTDFLLLNDSYTGTFDHQAEFPIWSINRDTNMLNGICLESVFVLDSFVDILRTFFSNYLG
ncbi:MAG: hypothetical protein ACFFFC_19280 [Candidatus Thorarchaeota archaeon]